MRPRRVAAIAICAAMALAAAAPAGAQSRVDLATLTCGDLLRQESPFVGMVFLSVYGYVMRDRGFTAIERHHITRFGTAIHALCGQEPQSRVLDVAGRLFPR